MSGTDVYPVLLLTNRDELKRKMAACKRTWDEWREFVKLMNGHCHYRYREAKTGRLRRVPKWFPRHHEARRRAIHDYLSVTTKDSRLLNLNIFQAFMYTGLPLRSIQKTMLSKEMLKKIERPLEDLRSVLRADRDIVHLVRRPQTTEEGTSYMLHSVEDEEHCSDTAAALLQRVVLEGYLDSHVDIPAERQHYETNMVPREVRVGDVLREAGLDGLFDEVGVDLLEVLPDVELERRREKDGMPWREDNDPDRGHPRWITSAEPSCKARLVIDYEKM